MAARACNTERPLVARPGENSGRCVPTPGGSTRQLGGRGRKGNASAVAASRGRTARKPRSRLAGRARPGRGWTRDAAVEIDGKRQGSKPGARDPRSGAGLRLDSGDGGVLPGSYLVAVLATKRGRARRGRFRSAAASAAAKGGAAEREVSALRGRTSTTATDGDDPRTGGSRVVPLSAKMAGVQPMGRVRPQASASPYRQQPQKRFSVRF